MKSAMEQILSSDGGTHGDGEPRLAPRMSSVKPVAASMVREAAASA